MLALILGAALVASQPLPHDQLVTAMNNLVDVNSYNHIKNTWINGTKSDECDAARDAELAAHEIRDNIFDGTILVPTDPKWTLHYLTDEEKHFLEGEARTLDSDVIRHKYACGD